MRKIRAPHTLIGVIQKSVFTQMLSFLLFSPSTDKKDFQPRKRERIYLLHQRFCRKYAKDKKSWIYSLLLAYLGWRERKKGRKRERRDLGATFMVNIFYATLARVFSFTRDFLVMNVVLLFPYFILFKLQGLIQSAKTI